MANKPFAIELNDLLNGCTRAYISLTSKDPEITSLEHIKSKSIVEVDNRVKTATHYIILKAEKQVIKCSSCNHHQAIEQKVAMQFGFTVCGCGYYGSHLDRDVKLSSETDDRLKEIHTTKGSQKIIINAFHKPKVDFISPPIDTISKNITLNAADVIYDSMVKGKLPGYCYTIEISPTKFNKSGNEDENEEKEDIFIVNIPHASIATTNELNINSPNASVTQLTPQESLEYGKSEKNVLNRNQFVMKKEVFKLAIVQETIILPVSSNETMIWKKKREI